MNKEEAAKFLGVSVRAVQRYAAAGKLSVTYTRGARGQVAQFNQEELERLKQQLSEPVYPQRPAIAESGDNHGQEAVAPVTPQALVTQEAFADRLIETLEALKPESTPPVFVAYKLTLNLKEAAQLAGLSRGFLLEAIHDGTLKAAKRGRGWNIKRTDLDAYVNKL